MYISQARAGSTNVSICEWNVERKFDTALRKSTINDLIYRFDNNILKRDDYVIKGWFKCGKPVNVICDTEFLPKILYKLLRTSTKGVFSNNVYRKTTKNLFHYAKTNLDIQLNHLFDNYEILNKPTALDSWKAFKTNIALTPEIQTLFGFQQELSQLINILPKVDNLEWRRLSHESRAQAVNQVNSWKSKMIPLSIRFSSLFCKMDLADASYLLPRPVIQELHNKVSDLLSVLLYSVCAQNSELPLDAYSKTVRFVLELCVLHIQYGDDFFAIAKSLESLVTAEILKQVDSEWPGGNSEFLNTLADNLKDTIDFNYFGTCLEHILRDVPIPLRNELGCLSKITGHPFVDMEEGTRSLFESNNAQVDLNVKLIGESVNMAKMNYIKQYILKRKCWPPCEIDKTAPDILHDACRFGYMPDGAYISRKFRRAVTIDMMVYVTLLPDMRFDFLENFIPQLKDRTISALKSKVVSSIFNVITDQSQANRIRSTDTRLLLYFITNVNEVLNHQEYINKYTYGELEELKEYLVIRVVPKEKELKPIYRGFGCTTYLERARRIVQEKNSKRYLSMYVPDQAMTTTELELARKLMGFRRLEEAYPGYKAIFINIDSSKWNSKFRDEAVRPMMKETLDSIFGFPIFSNTMSSYHKTFFYVPDGQNYFYWEGQLGGIEGLNQDTWVVIYLNQIHTAVKKFNERIPYFLLCKGDDLRVVLLISPKMQEQISLSNIKNDIVTHLQETLKQFGHTIKPDDSYGSGSYFTFSKRATVGTIGLTTAYRKIQKVYGANNALFPILDDFIASTFSNAHSAAHEAVTFVSSYFVALVWAYYYLINDLTIQSHNLTEDQLIALLLVPSNLGGFPIIYLGNMPVRSESDHLPYFIHLTQYCERVYPQVAQYMMNFLHFNATPITRSSQLEGLFGDIYSLPVNKPSLPNAALMKSLEKTLKQKCKNETILSIFEAKDSNYTDMVVDILYRANMYDAKVFHNIYAALPRPMLRELLALFESSRSIREALLLSKSVYSVNRTFKKVLKDMLTLLEWRLDTLVQPWIYRGSIVSSIYENNKCPALIADQMREKAWGKPVVNVTMPPMSHLIRYSTPEQIKYNLRDKRNNFLYRILTPNKYLIGFSTFHFASGRTDPFIGYITPSGTLAPTVNIIAKDMILQRVKNLIDLLPWCQVSEMIDGVTISSNVPLLIQQIVKDYTGRDLPELSPFSQQKRGGTISHHVRARDFREAIMPNDVCNRGQLVVGVADSHTECRIEAVKRRLNFLQIYCHSVVMLTIELDFSKNLTTPDQCSAVTVDCGFCWSEVKDRALVVDLNNMPKFPPFTSGFALSDTSLDILKESMGYFDVESLKPRDYQAQNVPIKIATLTLMSELIERTWEDKEIIADMYSAHISTAEGYNILRDVTGFSKQPVTRIGEIKCMPSHPMAAGLLTYIYSYVATRPPFCSNTIFQSQQMIMATTPSALPWIDCVSEIYKAGRLSDLLVGVEIISKLTAPMCYNYPGLAAQYIGVAACEAGRLNKLEVSICDHQYLTKASLIQKARPYVELIKYQISVEICETLVKVRSQELTLEQYYLLCTVPYIISSEPLSNELVEAYIKNSINEHDSEHMFELSIIEGQSLNPTLAKLPFPSICKIYPVLKQLYKSYPNLPWHPTWETVYNETNNVEMALNAYVQKQRLRIPVYITLLDQCVSSVRSNPSQLSKYSQLERHPTLMPLRTRSSKMDIGTCLRLTDVVGYSGPTELPANIRRTLIPTLGEFRNKIDAAFWSKIYGRSNSAAIKILSIIRGIIDLQQTTDHMAIACLGEGQGGVLGCLAELFPQSNFVYVSLPEGAHPTYLPDSALKSLDETDGRMLIDANQSMVYDLRESETIDQLILYCMDIALYVCDAQTDKSLEDLDILHINVARYIYETHQQTFVAIIKMDIENTKSIVRLSTIFKHCFGTSLYQFLCKPPGSQVNRECYLVVWGANLVKQSDFPSAVSFSTKSTYTSILNNLKTFQETVAVKNSNARNIKMMYYVTQIPQVFLHKPLTFFIHSFLSRYFSEVNAYVLHEIKNTKLGFSQIMKECNLRALTQLCRQIDYVEFPNKVATTSKADFNLLIRKIHMISDMFVMSGFHDTLTMLIKEIVEEHIDVSKVYIDFSATKDKCLKIQFLKRFKNACKLLHMDFNTLKKNVFQEKLQIGGGDNYVISPFEDYITGIHGCMAFYQTMLIKLRIGVYSGNKSLLNL
nr:MAG: RNA-dependent RNA polymerase [brine shrimp chuvirus 1]UIW13708.1 MAG: RNA-dependent RNA polymerase [brine shrimp chuvirus 1]UIW13709.1 MAG: RNA-dependent RNA polymerase [brine shrimp chuvirus 1]